MANDGKLYVIITDKREDDGNGGNTPTEGTSKVTVQKSSQSFVTHQFYNFISSQAKQFVNYQINNIGNFTGNYVTQRKVSEAMQVINIGMNIGMAGISGFTVGGVPGAIVGTVLATASIAINAGYESYTQRLQNAKTNYNINQLRKRSGLNMYTDGSRGTEN